MERGRRERTDFLGCINPCWLVARIYYFMCVRMHVYAGAHVCAVDVQAKGRPPPWYLTESVSGLELNDKARLGGLKPGAHLPG